VSPALRQRPDRCPGALSLHEAADGLLARVRLPGGRVGASTLHALAGLSEVVEITSRGNLQLRAVRADVADAVADLGLLPSATHERVRNIAAHPDPALDDTVRRLDAALCDRPALAQLPGRFLFSVGGHLDADIVLDGPWVHAGGRAVTTSDPVGTALDAAERFLHQRTDQWRVAELTEPVLDGTVLPPPAPRPLPTGTLPPLGRLSRSLCAQLHGTVVLTGERTIVLREPHAPVRGVSGPDWIGVTACAGAPRCASGRLDTAAAAVAYVAAHPQHGRVHVVGCEHRCGSPRGPHVEVGP
jgi:precorrin-3B synthase